MADFYKSAYGGMADGSVAFQRRMPVNQRGNGFFGRIIKGSLAPIIRSVLPYLKDLALDGVGGIVNELKEGKGVKEAATNQFKRTAGNLAEDMARRVRNRVSQVGSGVRRKRRRTQKGSGVSKKRRRQGRKRGAKRRKTTSSRPRRRGLFSV